MKHVKVGHVPVIKSHQLHLFIMRVFTLGYERVQIERFISILSEHQVGLVLDIREKAWSYKPAFVKSTLCNALSQRQIEYLHVPSAGNPSTNRKTASSPEECLRRYREYLVDNQDCITELLALIKKAFRAKRPACLTCYEREPHLCHRSILLEFLVECAPNLRVTHLPLELNARLPLLEEQSVAALRIP